MFKCKAECKAECCGIIPIPKKTFKKHKRMIAKKITSILSSGESVLPVTEDGLCAFINSFGKCIIYKERPLVCKLYGTEPSMPCQYLCLDGSPRSPQDVLNTADWIKAAVDVGLSKFRH